MAFAFTWKLINVNVKNYYLLQSNTVRIKFEFRGEKRWGCIRINSICLFFQSCECLKMWTLLGAKGNPKGRGFPHHFEPLCFFVGTFIIIIINYVIYFFSKIYNCIDLIVHGQVCSFICLPLGNIIFSKYTIIYTINSSSSCFNELICCFIANPVCSVVLVSCLFFVSEVYFVLFLFLFFSCFLFSSLLQCCQLLHVLSVIQ